MFTKMTGVIGYNATITSRGLHGVEVGGFGSMQYADFAGLAVKLQESRGVGVAQPRETRRFGLGQTAGTGTP